MTPTDAEKLEGFQFFKKVDTMLTKLFQVGNRINSFSKATRKYFSLSRDFPDQEAKWTKDAQDALANLSADALVDPDGPADGPRTLDILEQLTALILGDNPEAKMAAILAQEAADTAGMTAEELAAHDPGILITAYAFRNLPTPETSLESRLLDTG